jgi:hypothetical protein
MRPRFAVLGCALAASAVMSLPGIAGAAPRHNHGLTVNATPNPIIAGEGVLIYGQLKGTDIAGKAIVLFHHISGSGTGYSRIGSTHRLARVLRIHAGRGHRGDEPQLVRQAGGHPRRA